MDGGPFEPPAKDALVVVCNERPGTLVLVGEDVGFQPPAGPPERLPIGSLTVVSCTHDGRVTVGLPVAALAILVGSALRQPAETTLALAAWLGLLAWGVGTQLFPAVSVDLEGDGIAWKVTGKDAALATLARGLRRRMTASSLRTTTAEMLTDSAHTLISPGDVFPWQRRAYAAWLLASIPGPTLLAVLAFAWAAATLGQSGVSVLLAGLGLTFALAPITLLPGLLLQFPMMWALRRGGVLAAGVSSPPPEAG